MSKPKPSNTSPSSRPQLPSPEHHGWLPWWLPAWAPVVTLGGVLVIAAGIFLVVTKLVQL